ncbi:MAG: HD domain-containing protein [Epsilonproteobacteria bacterium]|nr:HD domain-containing protein [Campylobacterota bacterium]
MELLPEVAQKLKFKDNKFKTASLQLSKKVFESLWSIKTICNILIKELIQPFLYKEENIPLLRQKRFEKNLYICENTLFTSFHYPKSDITQILRELLTLPDSDYRYDISVVNALKHAAIKPKSQNEIASLVKKFFYRDHIYHFIYAIYQAGILHKIIPPMKKVIHLPQFDGYHTYPVDIHSIKVLKHLENIEDPYVKELFDSLSKDEKMVLKLVAFLHDAGKGRKKDHSAVGAELFKVYAKKLQIDENLAKIGALLIEHHTLMSKTAQREDIYNEKTILRFVSKIKTPQNLKMLYILTYADINGVSKSTYSSFNEKLLRELYDIAKKSFFNTELLSETQRRLKREKSIKNSEKFKSLPKILQKKILQIPSNLFFIKYKTDSIIEISKWAYELSQSDREYLYKIDYSQNLSISIIRKTELNAAYLLGKLSYLNLVNMDIFKLFNNIKYFKIEFLGRVEREEAIYIEQLIEDSFNMSRKVKYNKPCIYRNEISINCNHSESYAEMKLNTKDQKGLMAYLIAVFDDIGIDIASAKIQTIKKKASNLFILEKNGNFCKNLNKICDIIC